MLWFKYLKEGKAGNAADEKTQSFLVLDDPFF